MVEDIRQGDVPGVRLRCRQQLAAPINVVWSWLTTTDLLERWLAQHVRPKPDSAGSLILTLVDEADAVCIAEAESLELEAPHRWVLSLQQTEPGWPVATQLAFELVATAEGCELSVSQSGFAHLPISDCLTIWESYRRRWRLALSRLAEAIANR